MNSERLLLSGNSLNFYIYKSGERKHLKITETYALLNSLSPYDLISLCDSELGLQMFPLENTRAWVTSPITNRIINIHLQYTKDIDYYLNCVHMTLSNNVIVQKNIYKCMNKDYLSIHISIGDRYGPHSN